MRLALATLLGLALPVLAGGCGKEDDRGERDARCEAPAAPAADKDWIKSQIQKLMDEPRTVPAAGDRQSEVRGGAGAFAKLTAAEVDEFIASIIHCGDLFLPKSLSPQQRYALVMVDISAESAFRTKTSGANPNPAYGSSVGPQQVTGSIWVPMFQKRAQLPGLKHYDGSAWNPADTQMQAMQDSIWDSMVVANYAISEQAKSGAGNPRAAEFGEDVGQMPKTWWTGLGCWVSGYPAFRTGGDTGQRDHYRAMQEADLKLLGLPTTLLDTPF